MSPIAVPTWVSTALAAMPLQTPEPEFGDDGATFLLLAPAITLVGVIATVWSTRVLERRKVLRLMNVKSEAQQSDSLEELQADEIQARVEPQFALVDADSKPEAAVTAREAVEARERSLFWRAFFYDMLAALAYWLFPKALGSDEILEVGMAIATLLGGFSLIRVVVWMSHSRADTSFWAKLVRIIPQASVANPENRHYFVIGAIGVAVLAGVLEVLDGFYNPGLAVGLWAAAILHVWLSRRLLATARAHPNLRLVVLRVFGEEETAAFTFNGLLQKWKHFGTFFTVVDPSYLKSRSRHSDPFFALFFLGVVAALLLLSVWVDEASLDPILFAWLIVLPMNLALGVAYAYVILRGVGSGFVRSRDDLFQRLQHLDAKPRGLNLSFKSMPLLCHDNTWKIAVSECVRTSEAVLMDLRGFSEDRKGCEYEVDYLLDVLPIDRVVFLVDPEGVPLAQKLILERWSLLRTTSPNIDPRAPRATLYRTSAKDGEDIQGILDVLLATASRAHAGADEDPPPVEAVRS